MPGRPLAVGGPSKKTNRLPARRSLDEGGAPLRASKDFSKIEFLRQKSRILSSVSLKLYMGFSIPHFAPKFNLKNCQICVNLTLMKKAIIFLSIILTANIVSLFYSWYIKWWWFDISSHLLGGFFVAMLFREYLKDHLLKNKALQNTLILVGATVFIGVMWEFSEYIANQTLIDLVYRKFQIHAYFMGDLDDTVKDLVNDTLGGLTSSLIFLKSLKKSGAIEKI